MDRETLIVAIDRVAHKNMFVAKKVQGTLIDSVYHYFLEMLKGN